MLHHVSFGPCLDLQWESHFHDSWITACHETTWGRKEKAMKVLNLIGRKRSCCKDEDLSFLSDGLIINTPAAFCLLMSCVLQHIPLSIIFSSAPSTHPCTLPTLSESAHHFSCPSFYCSLLSVWSRVSDLWATGEKRHEKMHPRKVHPVSSSTWQRMRRQGGEWPFKNLPFKFS